MAKRRPDVQATERAVYRVTRGEREALKKLAERHGEKLRALGVSAGSENAWFRALLRREAEREGIEIVEPKTEPAVEPKKSRGRNTGRRAAAKR
ncbi:hypothetical protein WMF30_07415 [Sorangium sp. So ce134]